MKKLLVVAPKEKYMEVIYKTRERFGWGTTSHTQCIYWDTKPKKDGSLGRGYVKIYVDYSKEDFDWLVKLCQDTLPEGSWESFSAYEARLGHFARGWWDIEAQRNEEKGPRSGEHNKVRIRYR